MTFLEPLKIPSIQRDVSGRFLLVGEIRERDGDRRIIVYEGASDTDEQFLEESFWVLEGRDPDQPLSPRLHRHQGTRNITTVVGRPLGEIDR
ncbi:hypothetical protein [Rathayibacter sp. Leaf248]|uniref:hypothetical protein n=1 Tax=Rathayibacter sp. Leaf248 TaxID=2876555 RepID=UPI001E584BD5|nr:hypothetical protein [Rathayibacter sp. Leaf248]